MPELNTDPGTPPNPPPAPPENGSVTLTAQELKDLNERTFRGGFNESKERLTKQYTERFKTLGIELIDNDPLKTLEAVLSKSKSIDPTEKEKEFEGRLKAFGLETEKLKSETTQARQERDEYIIRSEVVKAIGTASVVDQSAVEQLFRGRYKIERVADGTIKVKHLNGEILRDDRFMEVTLEDAMKKFLADHPYLVKADTRGGTGGQPLTGSPEALAQIPPHLLTPEQRKTLYKDFVDGKL